jgi:oxygen-independent coproporphyrinogen-3 oxidase
VYHLSDSDAIKSVAYSQIKAKFAGYKAYYMYRQKNTVGNLENVGFSLEGHECMYNIFMMEETQTIFAVGAGAVTKLVKYCGKDGIDARIERIFNHKYPYEYLRRNNPVTRLPKNQTPFKERVLEFFEKQ